MGNTCSNNKDTTTSTKDGGHAASKSSPETDDTERLKVWLENPFLAACLDEMKQNDPEATNTFAAEMLESHGINGKCEETDAIASQVDDDAREAEEEVSMESKPFPPILMLDDFLRIVVDVESYATHIIEAYDRIESINDFVEFLQEFKGEVRIDEALFQYEGMTLEIACECAEKYGWVDTRVLGRRTQPGSDSQIGLFSWQLKKRPKVSMELTDSTSESLEEPVVSLSLSKSSEEPDELSSEEHNSENYGFSRLEANRNIEGSSLSAKNASKGAPLSVSEANGQQSTQLGDESPRFESDRRHGSVQMNTFSFN